MGPEKLGENITELEKIEGAIKICINSLYNEDVSKEDVAYVLEMTNNKLSIVKDEFDRITT